MSRITATSPVPDRWHLTAAESEGDPTNNMYSAFAQNSKRRLVGIVCGRCGFREIAGAWDVEGWGLVYLRETWIEGSHGSTARGPNRERMLIEGQWLDPRSRALAQELKRGRMGVDCTKCGGIYAVPTYELLERAAQSRISGEVSIWKLMDVVPQPPLEPLDKASPK